MREAQGRVRRLQERLQMAAVRGDERQSEHRPAKARYVSICRLDRILSPDIKVAANHYTHSVATTPGQQRQQYKEGFSGDIYHAGLSGTTCKGC